MNLYRYVPVLGLLMTLVACGQLPEKIRDEAMRAAPSTLSPTGLNRLDEVSAKPDQIEAAAARQLKQPAVKRSTKPWFGNSVTERAHQNLPASLTTHQIIDYGAEPVPPELVFIRLSQLTGVPIRYDSPLREKKVEARVVRAPTLEDGSLGSKEKARLAQIADIAQARARATTDPSLQLPVDLSSNQDRTVAGSADASKGPVQATEAASSLLMVWSGSVAAYLDWVSGQLGLTWFYDGQTVHVTRLKTVVYQLAAAAGKQSVRSSTTGTSNLDSGAGGGGGGGSAGSLSSSTNADADPFDATIKAIEALAKTEGGSVIVNQSAGTVVVTTTGPQHVIVRKYIDSENQLASHRFNVTFDLYTVSSNNSEVLGFDPKKLIGLHGDTLLQYSGVNSLGQVGAAGVLTMTRPMFDKAGNSIGPQEMVLQALRLQGYSVDHVPLSFITQNAIWDTKMRAFTTAYVNQLTTTTTPTTPPVTNVTAQTATLVTGDTFAAQPTLQPDGSVRLNYAITLKTLQNIRSLSTVGSSSISLQIPEVASLVTSSVVRLKPGENLLLTGLTRRTYTTSNARVGEDAPLALGGHDQGSIQTQHVIILIRVVQI